MKKKLKITDIILNQKFWYGGELMTRKQIMDDLEKEGLGKRRADFYLFCLENHQTK